MAINEPLRSPAWELRTLPLGTEPGLDAAVEGVAVDAQRVYLTCYLFNPQNPLYVLPEGRLA